MSNNGYTFAYTTSFERRKRILMLLREPLTRTELAERVSISVRGVQCYLTGLHAEGLVHISGWRKNSPGSPSALHLAGPGKDKPKPGAMTDVERSRKRRKDLEFCIASSQRQRLGRTRPHRDPLTAALFGPA